MNRSDDAMSLLSEALRGGLTRRDFVTRAAALGIGASAIAGVVAGMDRHAAAQDSGTPAPAATGKITWAIETDPVNLIPFGATSTSNMWGKEFIYDSLLEWDRDLNIQPALAESYEAAPDATSYTFKLRPGVKFHNGKDFVAADVKYSIETAINPPAPGVFYSFLANVGPVEIIDDLTVKINMLKSDPSLPGLLAWSRYTPIVPEGSGDQINWLSEGIGTGPFKLVEFIPNDSVSYTANETYWKPGVPCVQELVLIVQPDESARIATLRAGEIDGCTVTADGKLTVEGEDGIEVLSGLYSAPVVLQFNTVNEVPWRDVRVRQAINKVVDRQTIIDNVYGGEAVLTGAIAPGYGDWPLSDDELKQFYAVDVDGAKALMAEAGFADGFDVTLKTISGTRAYVQICEIIKEAVSQLNINVSIEPSEIGTFAADVGSGAYEWAQTGRGMRGDPSGFVIDFRAGPGNHEKWFGTGWNNDEINALYDEGLSTSDVARRHEIYTRIQQIIATDVPHLYQVQPLKFHAVRSTISGMYVSYTDFLTGLRTTCAVPES